LRDLCCGGLAVSKLTIFTKTPGMDSHSKQINLSGNNVCHLKDQIHVYYS
jgi:hypothetical protein